jgi:transposase-like protein
VKVRGQWAYLYRALDKHGNTIDFYLSPTRNAKAAKRFLGKALNGLKQREKPEVINTDKAPAYAIAISELKTEGQMSGGNGASTDQVLEQCRRGRPRQAEAVDPSRARFQTAEDCLCDHPRV